MCAVSIARARALAKVLQGQTKLPVAVNVKFGEHRLPCVITSPIGVPLLAILLPSWEPVGSLDGVSEALTLEDGQSVPQERLEALQADARPLWLVAFGELQRFTEWAGDNRCAVPVKTLRGRLAAGWPAEKAIGLPADESRTTGSASKPYPEFPLSRHSTGQWCKKIGGKIHYFGKGTWQEALERYKKEHESIRIGERVTSSPTIADLCNQFLQAKETAKEHGELTLRTWNDYHAMCARVVAYLGAKTELRDLTPARFGEFRKHLGEGVSITTLGNRVRLCRVLFRFAGESRLVEKPIDFARSFDLPPVKALRRRRWEQQQTNGFRMLTPEDIMCLLEVASVQLKAMILLGINCGLGNTDCSELPIGALDLTRGWLTFPRPKTMVMRECPLWPETIEAIQEVLRTRKEPATPEVRNRLFLTVRGAAWVRVTAKANDDAIAKEFAKLLSELKMKRPGLNFYALRHTFQTIAEGSGDVPAVRAIMGHVDASMSAAYREFVSEERLRAVVAYVQEMLGIF